MRCSVPPRSGRSRIEPRGRTRPVRRRETRAPSPVWDPIASPALPCAAPQPKKRIPTPTASERIRRTTALARSRRSIGRDCRRRGDGGGGTATSLGPPGPWSAIRRKVRRDSTGTRRRHPRRAPAAPCRGRPSPTKARRTRRMIRGAGRPDSIGRMAASPPPRTNLRPSTTAGAIRTGRWSALPIWLRPPSDFALPRRRRRNRAARPGRERGPRPRPRESSPSPEGGNIPRPTALLPREGRRRNRRHSPPRTTL
mmetsp:Transcript_51168/g.153731  ORF Transcript_51168/g.153731 Transcript_51168/m.153731 type:complete len:254 (+) Transcript_51168:760-1521(+)